MKFTFDQIKELHSMGFTPDQITSFATTSPETIPGDQAGADSEGDRADSPSDPAVVEPVDKPVETVDNSPEEPDTLRELRDEIKGLRASIQAQNIRTQSIETVNPDDALEKAMAEFIRPTLKKEE